MARDRYTTERIATMVGEGDDPEVFEFSRVNIAPGLNVIVQEGSEIPQNKEAIRSQLSEILKSNFFPPEVAQDPAFMGKVLDLFDLTDDAFKSWDLMSAIGPISGTGQLLQWGVVNILVAHLSGDLVLEFASGLTEGSFESTLVAAVPLPAALPLLASALALFGLLGWRRRVLTSA